MCRDLRIATSQNVNSYPDSATPKIKLANYYCEIKKQSFHIISIQKNELFSYRTYAIVTTPGWCVTLQRLLLRSNFD